MKQSTLPVDKSIRRSLVRDMNTIRLNTDPNLHWEMHADSDMWTDPNGEVSLAWVNYGLKDALDMIRHFERPAPIFYTVTIQMIGGGTLACMLNDSARRNSIDTHVGSMPIGWEEVDLMRGIMAHRAGEVRRELSPRQGHPFRAY